MKTFKYSDIHLHHMATITINISEKVEQEFRKKAYQTYGRKKGVLGKAITEAILEWSKKKEYLEECMNLLDKGIDMGKIKYTKREELHDRN